MSATVNSLLAMKHKLKVSSVKSVKHDGNLIIADGGEKMGVQTVLFPSFRYNRIVAYLHSTSYTILY